MGDVWGGGEYPSLAHNLQPLFRLLSPRADVRFCLSLDIWKSISYYRMLVGFWVCFHAFLGMGNKPDQRCCGCSTSSLNNWPSSIFFLQGGIQGGWPKSRTLFGGRFYRASDVFPYPCTIRTPSHFQEWAREASMASHLALVPSITITLQWAPEGWPSVRFPWPIPRSVGWRVPSCPAGCATPCPIYQTAGFLVPPSQRQTPLSLGKKAIAQSWAKSLDWRDWLTPLVLSSILTTPFFIV